MIYVLDACAVIAYVRKEPGVDVVRTILIDRANQISIHAVNLCEVYYDFLRTSDESTADSVISDLRMAGVIVKEDMDQAFWQNVGRLKITHKISLADCFAIALTLRTGGTLVTSDHHEFDPLVAPKVCPITFIR